MSSAGNQNRRSLSLKEGHFYGPTNQPLSVQPQGLVPSLSNVFQDDSISSVAQKLSRQSGTSLTGNGSARSSVSSSILPRSSTQTKNLGNSLSSNFDNPIEDNNRTASLKTLAVKNASAPGFSDRIVFAQSMAHPNIPVVFRTEDERATNPDRLSLDHRGLTSCPILEGEDNLRLLNYQHNFITKIQNVAMLKKLIFLDLYDNQIQSISGLSALKSLRVLMLGKNQIRRIEGLEHLVKLDVLDLHGNKIETIENLQHLTELRVLNLAGNMITHVTNLSGMQCLTEMNLRRNRIRMIEDVDALSNLQRLFLSFNEISCWYHVKALASNATLSELTLDGNPFAKEAHYKQTVIANLLQLRQLDMKRILDEERRIAVTLLRKEAERVREQNKMAAIKEKRRMAINNAKQQFEMCASGLPPVIPALASDGPSPLDGVVVTDRLVSRPDSSTSLVSGTSSASRQEKCGALSSEQSTLESESPASVVVLDEQFEEPLVAAVAEKKTIKETTHLAELNGDTLSLYGAGSLDALDRPWGLQAAGTVLKIVFQFIEFDDIVRHLSRLRARFPALTTLTFHSVNLRSYSQLNALLNVRRLDAIHIDAVGNPITEFKLWRYYLLFRLSAFKLKCINGDEVTETQVRTADQLFGGIAQLSPLQFTQPHLLAMIDETRRRLSPADTAKLMNNHELIGRLALTHCPEEQRQQRQAILSEKQRIAESVVTQLVGTSSVLEQRKTALMKAWPSIMAELIGRTLSQVVLDRQVYMKRCWQEFLSLKK